MTVSSAQVQTLSNWVSSVQPAPPCLGRGVALVHAREVRLQPAESLEARGEVGALLEAAQVAAAVRQLHVLYRRRPTEPAFLPRRRTTGRRRHRAGPAHSSSC
jgi:hypothetical protein